MKRNLVVKKETKRAWCEFELYIRNYAIKAPKGCLRINKLISNDKGEFTISQESKVIKVRHNLFVGNNLWKVMDESFMEYIVLDTKKSIDDDSICFSSTILGFSEYLTFPQIGKVFKCYELKVEGNEIKAKKIMLYNITSIMKVSQKDLYRIEGFKARNEFVKAYLFLC